MLGAGVGCNTSAGTRRAGKGALPPPPSCVRTLLLPWVAAKQRERLRQHLAVLSMQIRLFMAWSRGMRTQRNKHHQTPMTRVLKEMQLRQGMCLLMMAQV